MVSGGTAPAVVGDPGLREPVVTPSKYTVSMQNAVLRESQNAVSMTAESTQNAVSMTAESTQNAVSTQHGVRMVHDRSETHPSITTPARARSGGRKNRRSLR